MKVIMAIVKRELKLVTVNKALLLIFMLAPVVYSFMYGSIYLNKMEQKVKLAVVDMDNSELSRMITSEVNITQMADVETVTDLESARNRLYYGSIQGYLFIEKGLQQKVLSLQTGTITLTVNASRFLPSSDLTAAITKIALTLGTGIRMKYLSRQGSGTSESLQQANPVVLDYRPLYNSNSSYGAFLLPGLLAIILQQTLLIGLVASMGIERQQHFSGLPAQASVSAILTGKGVFYLATFLIFELFFIIINFSVLKIPMRGNASDLMLITALFIATIIPMGLLIGSFFKSPLLGMQVMAFSSYPIFLITGYSMPYHSLPEVVQVISALLPTTPFLRSYQSVVQAGGNLLNNKEALLHLAALWVIYAGGCLWRLAILKRKFVMR